MSDYFEMLDNATPYQKSNNTINDATTHRHINECMDCGYIGKDWYETDAKRLDGRFVMLCPKCHSEYYQEQEGDCEGDFTDADLLFKQSILGENTKIKGGQ